MKTLAPHQRREIAVDVNASKTKKGKIKNYNWINSEAELLEQFEEYVRRYVLDTFEADHYLPVPTREVLAEHDARVAAGMLEDHMPALTFFFKRYLAQH